MKYDETEIRVRFNEVDSWGMAWHGHFIAWFEVGRMNLLGKFHLLPSDFTQMGYIVPVVDLECVFKEPALLDEELLVRTTVEKPIKAALTFHFQVLRKSDGKLLASGKETQVLITLDGRMLYFIPPELKDKLQPLFDYLVEPNSAA
ncbi:MAG: thioesterase family protein [Deltaproteobacteria bacterium]|nr:thioesterase family protein [Deltaproteobacteria bacterium]